MFAIAAFILLHGCGGPQHFATKTPDTQRRPALHANWSDAISEVSGELLRDFDRVVGAKPLKVAVFSISMDDPSTCSVSHLIASGLADRLAQSSEATLVESQRNEQTHNERSRRSMEFATRPTMEAIGRMYGVDGIVTSSVYSAELFHRIEARVVLAKTGELISIVEAAVVPHTSTQDILGLCDASTPRKRTNTAALRPVTTDKRSR